jgi:hypothetical protein
VWNALVPSQSMVVERLPPNKKPMKAKVSDFWWDMFLSTTKCVDEDQRKLLIESVRNSIEFLPRQGTYWPNDVEAPLPTAYTSQSGLTQLLAGNKAIVRSTPDSLNSIPLFAGVSKL